jgi:hypothetical protein
MRKHHLYTSHYYVIMQNIINHQLIIKVVHVIN